MKLVVHPCSAIFGASLLGVVLLVIGATQVTKEAVPMLCQLGPVKVVGIPDPRDMLVIREGSAYAVPTGKLFVLTALGNLGTNSYSFLRIDGVEEVTASSYDIAPVAQGFTVESGSVIEVDDKNGAAIGGRAWGYLIDD